MQNHKLGMKYNFHGYIQRTMEDDFKVVVGIRFVQFPQLLKSCHILLSVYGVQLIMHKALAQQQKII